MGRFLSIHDGVSDLLGRASDHDWNDFERLQDAVAVNDLHADPDPVACLLPTEVGVPEWHGGDPIRMPEVELQPTLSVVSLELQPVAMDHK